MRAFTAPGVSTSYTSRILRLALLAPNIAGSILEGRDHALTPGRLERPFQPDRVSSAISRVPGTPAGGVCTRTVVSSNLGVAPPDGGIAHIGFG
jgi:hypothetical protein